MRDEGGKGRPKELLGRRMICVAAHNLQNSGSVETIGETRFVIRAPLQGASTLMVIPRAKALGCSVMPLRANRPIAPSPIRPFALSPPRRYAYLVGNDLRRSFGWCQLG